MAEDMGARAGRNQGGGVMVKTLIFRSTLPAEAFLAVLGQSGIEVVGWTSPVLPPKPRKNARRWSAPDKYGRLKVNMDMDTAHTMSGLALTHSTDIHPYGWESE
jgi:hypothetical protein